MPPHVPRKRTREASPVKETKKPRKDAPTKQVKPAPKIAPKVAPKPSLEVPRKPTLFDDLDTTSTPDSAEKRKAILEDSDSSLSSLSDDDFEDVDVPVAKKRKTVPVESEDDDSEDSDEFEDVDHHQMVPQAPKAPAPTGDLTLTLVSDNRVSLLNSDTKKGPSKVEKRLRISTHCMHVQFLMWHNAVRNSWLCDPEVQGLLLSHIPPGLWEEVDRWRRASGLEAPPPEAPKKKQQPPKGKGKTRAAAAPAKPSRDWGEAADRLERGAVDLSHGDPLFRLMKALASWWKKRFRITAPGLRKWGYMSLERLDSVIKAYNEDGSDAVRFGERIRNLEEFRKCAQDCAGGRDVGAQLFTAMLRGLGLDARMVASLQPLGFGWNKLEEADAEKEKASSSKPTVSSKADAPNGKAKAPPKKAAAPARAMRKVSKPALVEEKSFELLADDSNDDDVVEIPQTTPKKAAGLYDKDLECPIYWTEVLSPVTKKYLSVDPIVKSIVATNRDLVESFEPRGAKADKAKQLIAYVLGYSQDGTARDVTVRYLKRQIFPGKTKGTRLPVEKVPVHNRNGKVVRYEYFDWFKAVMRGYERGTQKTPLTEIDEQEQSTDLKPAVAEKKEVKEGEETLQYYKQSKEFVLERHLKREEALLRTAKPVKTFKIKGAKGSETTEEPVYSRKDVVQVKSAETWHKQGRAPIPGEEPLKKAPYRAATTNRRRELAEAEARSGHKVLQGLFGYDQTDWIIPDPIKDGVIPKNAYGNIDLFAEHMCPRGAVHVPYRGCKAVCKRLGVDFAEAVVDFEFGHRMAVPVIQGVVIPEEHHDRIMEELAKDEAERSRKEDEKRRKVALGMWRKFLMGMRIVERIERDHGEKDGDDLDMSRDITETPVAAADDDDDMGGGFLREGYEVPVQEEREKPNQGAGFFMVADDDGSDDDDLLQVDYGGESGTLPTPQSGLNSGKDELDDEEDDMDDDNVEEELLEEEVQAPRLRRARPSAAKSTPVSSSRRRRPVQASSDEEEEDMDDENGAEEILEEEVQAPRLRRARPSATKSTPLSSSRRRGPVQVSSDEEEDEDQEESDGDDGDYDDE